MRVFIGQAVKWKGGFGYNYGIVKDVISNNLVNVTHLNGSTVVDIDALAQAQPEEFFTVVKDIVVAEINHAPGINHAAML